MDQKEGHIWKSQVEVRIGTLIPYNIIWFVETREKESHQIYIFKTSIRRLHLRQKWTVKIIPPKHSVTSCLPGHKELSYIISSISFCIILVKCIGKSRHEGLNLAPDHIIREWQNRSQISEIQVGILPLSFKHFVECHNYNHKQWKCRNDVTKVSRRF